MYYALRIRNMYQEPKARRRGPCTTHYVSALCIKHRKPAGESYVLRTTYPYYVSLELGPWRAPPPMGAGLNGLALAWR